MALICWRGPFVPVVGSNTDREKPITVPANTGSVAWVEMLLVSAPSFVRSRSWSQNWPHCQTMSERFRTLRTEIVWAAMAWEVWGGLGAVGPAKPNSPSLYAGVLRRRRFVPAAPQDGLLRLLLEPS